MGEKPLKEKCVWKKPQNLEEKTHFSVKCILCNIGLNSCIIWIRKKKIIKLIPSSAFFIHVQNTKENFSTSSWILLSVFLCDVYIAWCRVCKKSWKNCLIRGWSKKNEAIIIYLLHMSHFPRDTFQTLFKVLPFILYKLLPVSRAKYLVYIWIMFRAGGRKGCDRLFILWLYSLISQLRHFATLSESQMI